MTLKPPDPDWLAEFQAAAHAAQASETAFRKTAAAQIAEKERARQYAFRRLGLVRAMVAVARLAPSRTEAMVALRNALQAELGWIEETEARRPVLDAWTPVSASVWAALHPDAPDEDAAAVSVPAALAGFEAWYEERHGKPFLSLFDQEIPEFPLVEF